VYDPTDPVGQLLFNVLAMVAEFESDLIRLRTREGMRVAKAKGRLRGKQPKLNRRQEAHLVDLFNGGEYSTADLADLFGVARSTVYRAVQRARTRNNSGRRHRGLKNDCAVPRTTPLRDSKRIHSRRPPHTPAVPLRTHAVGGRGRGERSVRYALSWAGYVRTTG